MAMPPLTNLRNKLKSLCTFHHHFWSYAIFWRFHPRNSMLLSFEEAYSEEQLGEEDIVNQLPQVQLLGEGIVGEAAFTGKHSWMHSDAHSQNWNLSQQNISEDDSVLHQQFSSGIKTIVVIPVRACGVVLFGSKKKILENVDFLNQTQSLLMETNEPSMFDVSGSAVSSLDFENNELNGLLASISSENSYDWNLKHTLDENSEELLSNIYSTLSPYNPFPSKYMTHEEGMTSLQGNSSFLDDQLKSTTESQVVLSDSDNTTNVLLNPNTSMNNLISQNSFFDALSGDVSCFDVLRELLVSEVWETEDAENEFASSKNVVQDSALASTNKGSLQEKLGNSVDNQYSCQSSVVTNVEKSELLDMSEDFLKFSSMDNVSQWFALSPEENFSLSESTEFNPASFDLVGNCSLIDFPEPVTSSVMDSSLNGVLDNTKLEPSGDQGDKWWMNMLKLTDADFSECLSELNTDTKTGSRKRLFSELGIEELLRGDTSFIPNSSNLKSDLSPNRRQIEFSSLSTNSNSVHFTNLPRADLMQPIFELDRMKNLLCKTDTFPKVHVGMRIDDRHSINIARAVPGHPQKPEEPTKPTKKRAKPGESARPRPKDRQQIQDCIKELRGIIPHGGKCSIDSLLSRTIKYMKFLQSVLNYADKFHEPNEPKLIEEANGVVLKDSNMENSKNGATWALEVGQKTMLCPIIVEDMNPPGQMLIEMLYEDQGFFLEIVDTVRCIGLIILKAKMEIRKNKLWSRFIVKQQADRYVTRIDVFLSLMHLLQQSNTSAIDSAKDCNLIDSNIIS